jgi:hypothetical protein
MAIIRYNKNVETTYAYLNIFPDQFKTEKEKQDDSWIKSTMDFFSNKAYAQYVQNRETFVKNYDLVKGILRMEDFYQDPDTKSFTDVLTADLELPKYVKMYSIVTTPINELVGEVTKRPDNYAIKAFDDDSRAEELQYKTETLQNFILDNARMKIMQKLKLDGEEASEEEIQQMTLEQVKDQIDSYTSIAEKWANHVLTCQKADFNIKEQSEENFRHLLISNHQYYHIYEDNSKLGFNAVVENPKNVWNLSTADKKYTSDPSGRARGAYASGTVKVMELSEIIEAEPDLTKEEIDHLRTAMQDYGLLNVRESNLTNGSDVTGIDSITYDTYNPLVLQSRMMIEAELRGDTNADELQDFLGVTNNVNSFGYKYVVVTAYWASKKKVGKLRYKDIIGNIQSTLVDETYKSGTIPTEISLEWGWVNQWYQGKKYGPDVYIVKPLRILNYNPIIGTAYEIVNTESRSLIDLMKPFQATYNVCMNQMWRLLEKEIGNVASINVRRVPRVKNGDAQDDIDIWEMEARERGIMFDDDSPENTKAPVTNTSVARNVDLTRTNEIQSRYNLAVQIKNECWELIGMSKQRMGSVTASETATGTNAALTQSYTQTEPLFVAHEYVLGQYYQAIVDASLYTQSSKPESTISYITSEGLSAFVQVNGTDIALRDLKVFPTNRPEDVKMYNELRQLSQAIIQNGGSLYDVIELYSDKSMRAMKKVFRDLRDKQEAIQQQAIQQKQQELDQNQQQAIAAIEQAKQQHAEQLMHDDNQAELDRINRKEIAIIQATGFGKVESQDLNNNSVPDIFEADRLINERDKANKDYQNKLIDIQSKERQNSIKVDLEHEKLKVERENQANDLEIAKINLKNRTQNKK